MRTLISAIKDVDLVLGERIKSINKERQILLELKRGGKGKQQKRRELIHWFLLKTLISKPSNIRNLKKIINISVKKGRRVPISNYVSILLKMSDEELFSVFKLFGKKVPDFIDIDSKKSSDKEVSNNPFGGL